MDRWIALGVLCFATIAARAQDRTSTIMGSVTDSEGALVEAAAVRATHIETGTARTTLTAATGAYRLMRLEVGEYVVTAEKTGFKTSRHEDVTLELDRAAVVNHHLVVGDHHESVLVTGQALLIEATPSALTSLVDSAAIDQLPLNGRDFIQLATLQGGTAVARAQGRGVNTGYGLQISISGSRPFQNSFRLDGVTFTSYNGSTPGNINGTNLGVDAIAEFSVNSSAYSAQYGQAGGGVINAVTKSGSNGFHGTGFYFHRNDNFDARNFFDPSEPPEFRRHQYGASLGGPIRRQQTFFFTSYEGLREARGNTTTNTTLSAEARKGNLTSGTIRVHPNVARILDLYPLPNGPVLGDTGLFIFANDRINRGDYLTNRLDQELGESGKLFGRFSLERGLRRNETDFALGARKDWTRQLSAVIEETHILSSQLLNTARVGFLRTRTTDGETATQNPATDDPELAFRPDRGVIGTMVIPGITDFPGGSNAVNQDRHVINSYQLSNDLSYSAGSHSLKWGVRFERTHFNTDSQDREKGEYRFRDVNRFLRGVPDRFLSQLPGSDTIRGHRQWIGALYVQDTWRLFSRMTLDAGIRWEWNTVPAEVNGKVANLDRITDTQMRVGDPLFHNPSLKNFAPRLGLAWDPTGTGRTLVRAGYGLFPDLVLSPYIMISGVRNPPFFVRGETRNLQEGDFPKGGFSALARNPTVDLTVDRLDPNLRQPYVQQWNFNIEQALDKNTSVRAAYVGSHGLNLSNVVADSNLVQPTTLPDGRLFYPAGAKTINSAFAQIRDRRFDAHSFYHALQTWFRRRLNRGVQAQASYTFSKSMDDSSNFASATESGNRGVLPLNGNPKFNRGLSGHHVRHYLTATGMWDLPTPRGAVLGRVLGGWRAASLIAVSSGLPTTAWLGYDSARTQSHQPGTSMGQRPDLAPGASANPVTGDPRHWVDIHAFRRPEPGFQGNLGRNTISGPGLANTDFSLVKRLPLSRLSEGAALDLRFEFFNLLNRTNFDLPALERMEAFNESGSREDFGRITTAAPSREIQFGLKLRF